jgi:hypothetical protein
MMRRSLFLVGDDYPNYVAMKGTLKDIGNLNYLRSEWAFRTILEGMKNGIGIPDLLIFEEALAWKKNTSLKVEVPPEVTEGGPKRAGIRSYTGLREAEKSLGIVTPVVLILQDSTSIDSVLSELRKTQDPRDLQVIHLTDPCYINLHKAVYRALK